MWQWILLFIVLTPGVLFTIPPYGKKFVKGVSGTVVTAILHGVVFAAAARFFMLCKEGFEGFQSPGSLCMPGHSCTFTVNPCPAGSVGRNDREPFNLNPLSGDRIECEPCLPGTFNNVPGNNKCAACSTGRISATSGATSCTKCPSGQVPNSDKTACVSSSPSGGGTGDGGGGGDTVSNRIQCPSGKGSIRSGALGFYTWGATCETCPAGTYSSQPIASGTSLTSRQCKYCPNDKPYSNAGATGFAECRATQ